MSIDAETGQTLMKGTLWSDLPAHKLPLTYTCFTGMGELHLEVVKHKLLNDFKVIVPREPHVSNKCRSY